jgi:hypothetical protein
MVAGMTLSALLALVLTRFTLGGRAAARACAP